MQHIILKNIVREKGKISYKVLNFIKKENRKTKYLLIENDFGNANMCT